MSKIFYFGYGANMDKDMMAAITGTRSMPEPLSAIVEGYELCIQKWQEISQDIRRVLSQKWDDTFATYCLRKTYDKRAIVAGKIWELKPEEFELISNWEMHGRWYERINSRARVYNGEEVDVISDAINSPSIIEIVDGIFYNPFLNDKAKMLDVASEVRMNL